MSVLSSLRGLWDLVFAKVCTSGNCLGLFGSSVIKTQKKQMVGFVWDLTCVLVEPAGSDVVAEES